MLKHLVMAVSMSAVFASGALAQATTTPPTEPQVQSQPQSQSQNQPMAQPSGEAQPGTAAATTPRTEVQSEAKAEGAAGSDQCLQSAMTLAQSAEGKKLADDKLDKIEQMLARMEDHCDARQYSEAQAMAKDIESAINAQ